MVCRSPFSAASSPASAWRSARSSAAISCNGEKRVMSIHKVGRNPQVKLPRRSHLGSAFRMRQIQICTFLSVRHVSTAQLNGNLHIFDTAELRPYDSPALRCGPRRPTVVCSGPTAETPPGTARSPSCEHRCYWDISACNLAARTSLLKPMHCEAEHLSNGQTQTQRMLNAARAACAT